MHLGSSEPVFAGGTRFRRLRPFPGVHRVAAAGPQAGGAPRLGFFDLRGNELVAYTRCAQASSRRVEPRRRRRPVRAREKDKRHSCILMAGRARNTDGTHTRASSGARSVVSGPFSEACGWHSCSDFIACDKSSRLNCHVCDHQWRGAGPYASGFVACSPRRYRRIGRDSPATCLVRRGIH